MKEKITNIGIPLALLLLVLALVTTALIKHNSQVKDDAVAVTVPIELNASETARNTSIGLIVTVGNENAEGSEWNQAASGAKVAVERFNRSGANITLVTEDDRGTAEGAVRAVESLAGQNVSGIVFASRGEHTQQALQAAQEHGIPVIMPYEESGYGAWSLRPLNDAMRDVLEQHNASSTRVVRIDQEDFSGVAVPAEETLTVNASTDLGQLAREVTDATAEQGDSATVVINASSYMQARLVKALQESGTRAKIVLGYEATSPTFSEAFMQDNDSTVINALSMGFNTSDAVALQADGQGRSMSAFLQMVRILNETPTATNALGDQKFSDVAHAADSRSHDAVVALVRATERASSAAPEDVRESLATLDLSASDGVTGPNLDFSSTYAVAASPIMLSPTVGDVEIRNPSAPDYQHIIWFNNGD
ncbi:hypothetical protein A7979_04095 [Rothia nasimurium]|uniref:Leucine-binding protein domain-containing protein n=1 Tax=Rothia nasimurium TaxID=85336 RepID=A0A1Y1RNU8_9MICC|nr:ABC transporter substrate-binding protein [Rothia nasimurium]ORC16507.1 hypothetical protein A7979_04095 [Rothia nasimurium]